MSRVRDWLEYENFEQLILILGNYYLGIKVCEFVIPNNYCNI